jgi:hypothetical protein
MYKDINVIKIGEDPAPKKKFDPTADSDITGKQFFSDPFALEGHKKRRRHCDTDSAEVPWGELLIVDDIPESDYK